MTLMLRCINNAYTDCSGELRFKQDKDYMVLGEYSNGNFILINENNEEHTVSGVNSKWFNRHFKVLI